VWSGPAIAAVLYIGLGSSVFSYLFWVAAVPKVGAARASLFQYLIPVFAALFAYLLVDERVRRFHLVGAALIVGGIVFASRKPRPG
jgi:drug/metabolite transporter (DMT)-like permease